MKNTIIKLSLICMFTMVMVSAKAQDLTEAIKMYNYERYESAKKILAPLAATNPQANYYLGLAELGLRNTKAAKEIFAKQPADAANLAGMARTAFLEGNKDVAMQMLNGLVAKAKKKDIATTLKFCADAITYTSGGDLNKAIEWYKKSNELAESAETYLAMGDAHNDMQGGGGNAMSRWEDAVLKMTNPSRAYYKMGKLWYDAKNYDSAISCYNRSSSLDPTNPLPYRSFAESYYKISKFDLAKENIEKYMKVSDNTTYDYLYYVNILYQGADYKGVIAKVDELSAKKIDLPYIQRLKGFSNMKLGNYPAALTDMEKFFSTATKSDLMQLDYFNYAKILLKTPGKEALAAENFQKGFDFDKTTDVSGIYREMAEEYKNNGDYKNAAMWYDNLIANSANTATMLDYYYGGYCNYAIDNYAQAAIQFAEVDRQNPTDPTGVYWQARTAGAIDSLAKTGGAEAFYKRYLEMVGNAADRQSEIAKSYEYLALLAFKRNDKTNAATYATKAIEANPQSELGKEIMGMIKK